MIKTFFSILLISMMQFAVLAQDSTMHTTKPFRNFERNTSLLTLSFGCSDYSKQNYSMPDSSRFGSGSMSMPLYLRAERIVGAHLSIAASIAYDVYYYNYSLEGNGNGNTFYRPQSDKVRVISPGLQLYYHFNGLIQNHNWDVFIGAGAKADYVKHTNYPTADTISKSIKPDIAPMIRLGARYYINQNAAFFGDIGYDKTSLFSLGFSYRLYGRLLSL